MIQNTLKQSICALNMTRDIQKSGAARTAFVEILKYFCTTQ